MKKRNRFLNWGVWSMMGVMCCMTSCDEDIAEDDHYKRPSFLVGNAYEVLAKDASYSIFLQGIDLAGYKDIVDSQILTVLAPTNEAFEQFLSERGYQTIEEMHIADPQGLKELIGYHLLYYAMDWDKMVNFRPNEGDGATEDQKNLYAGLYHKFRTRCAPADTYEFNDDPLINDTVRVCHYDRYVPVFSSRMFETMAPEMSGYDAKANYEYFYPNSTWTGDNYAEGLQGGFNIGGASVLDEHHVVTDNGYLYHINRVLEPNGTIHEELKKREDYSKFFALVDNYSYYTMDEVESENRGYVVYNHFHNYLPNIAMEWYVSDYKSFSINSRYSQALIAPSDQAMDKMFSEFWDEGCGYASVEELNPLIQQYFIRQSYAATNEFCFPGLIHSGVATTSFGTPINIDLDNVTDRIVCCNGVIYGSDNMDVPAVFSSVVGPAFKDVRYLPYLFVLDGSGLVNSLASNQSQFVALIPDTTQFSMERMRIFHGTEGDVLQIWDDEAGAYVPFGSSAKTAMVNIHTTTDVAELKTEGAQVIETNEAFNYWFIKDGQITTNSLFNQQLIDPTFNPFVPFTEIERSEDKTWDNGKAYAYSFEGIFEKADEAQSLEMELSICADKNMPYYVFSQLLRLSGLASDGKFASLLTLDPESPRFIALIPTNEALAAVLTELPGASKLKIDANYKVSGSISSTNKPLLAAYLTSYFITADRNSFTTYPYPGWAPLKNEFETGGSFGVKVTDDGSALSVNFIDGMREKAEGNVVPVVDDYSYLPFAYSDGCFQLLDGVLK